MARRNRIVKAPVYRSGLSRRAFVGVCAGVGALAASLVLWRNWPPGRSSIEPIDPVEPEDDPPLDPVFVHPPVPEVEPIVRVLVHRVRDEREPLLVGADGQWLRVWQAGDEMRRGGTALRGPLRIRVGAAGWSVVDSLGFTSDVAGLDPFTVTPDERERNEGESQQPATVELSRRPYPGVLRFISRTSIDPTAFDVVNDVPLEEYLPGVVARELYNHWHYETHAAQAIAARSFACAEHAYFRDRRHFDLRDDQSSQVYAGATTHSTSLEAVAATRGQVLAYEGLLVPGYYSSCCGGTAAAGSDAIGPNPINAIAPLWGQSEPDICSSAPVCTWRTQRPIEMSTRRIVAWAKRNGHSELAELQTLTSIEPAAHNAHGRPTHYTLKDDSDRTFEVPAERLRFALNHSEPGLHAPARALRSSHFTATFHGEDIVFDGHGFGHGVGMCQHGAQIRARVGADHREILHWYYPGAEIVTAYE